MDMCCVADFGLSSTKERVPFLDLSLAFVFFAVPLRCDTVHNEVKQVQSRVSRVQSFCFCLTFQPVRSG